MLIKIKPFGGVGQIGSNMTLIETPTQKIIIDSGILFPYEDAFDIRYLVPDLTYLKDPSDIIFTHGHEDHVGAVRYMLQRYPSLNLWSSAFTAALIKKKLEGRKKLNIYKEETVLKFSEIDIHPIHVNHSIPETFGLLIIDKKKECAIFYVSDFKVDDKSPYEKSFNFSKLIKLSSSCKTRVLLADSTNITSSVDKTCSEGDIIDEFESIVSSCKSRIFITLFASNVHRCQTIVNCAKKFGKKVVPYGQSVISYMQTASDLGILNNFEEVYQSADSIDNQKNNVIIIVSGCQGDFRSTLRRVVMGNDAIFSIRKGDLIVFSSKAIPGNEKKIGLIVNYAFEQGAQVLTPDDRNIHVSGHPGVEDLRLLYKKFDPTHAMPIHGETMFLHKHLDFIKQNFPKVNSKLVMNHDEILVDTKKGVMVVDKEGHDPILIHGKDLPIERRVISQRRKMASTGAIFMSIRKETLGKRKIYYDYKMLGIPEFDTKETQMFEKFLARELQKIKRKSAQKDAEKLRVGIRKYLNEQLGYKPVTIIHCI